MTSTMMMMHVRSDILQALGMAVPRTWDELITAVAAANGTDFDGDGQKEWGICLEEAPGCFSASTVFAALGSMVQVEGISQGSFFTETGDATFSGSAAMKRALEIYVTLYKWVQQLQWQEYDRAYWEARIKNAFHSC